MTTMTTDTDPVEALNTIKRLLADAAAAEAKRKAACREIDDLGGELISAAQRAEDAARELVPLEFLWAVKTWVEAEKVLARALEMMGPSLPGEK